MPEAEGQSPPQVGAVVDPYRNYGFSVQIQDIGEFQCTECIGMSMCVQAIPYRASGTNQIVRMIPGAVRYGEVTLRYGLTDSREVWDWLMSAATGNVQRRHVSIVMLDAAGAREAVHWNMLNAWCSGWNGVHLIATGNEIALEEVRLVYDSLEKS